MADPSGGPDVACSSTVLLCPAVPSGSLLGLLLLSFSTNLESTAALQDAMVTTTTPGSQRVSICTCTRTGRHLATFTRRPGSSLYTLATEPPQVAAFAQVSASGQVPPPSSCRILSHQTLLWHHRLGHPSLPRLCGMHSCLLVYGLPKSLHPLPTSSAPPCLPCVEGRQRAAPHSSFLPTTAPLQTLHMHVWGPALIPVQYDLLRDFCCGEGILQSFTLPDSPQQNGIAERRIGLVMEVARTSMIHAAAPHSLWPFAVRYAAHQLNLWSRVSLPETSPTLRWTGKVGDASVFRVWGSRAFVRDTSADKLSAHAIPCVFLGFVRNAPGWQFYHPTSRCFLPSMDVTFDESVPFCHLFPYRSAPLPPPPLFLAPGPSLIDPLPPQGPAPSGVSQVDPTPGAVPGEVAVESGAARGTTSGGAEPRGAEPGGAEPGGAETRGAEPGGTETGGAEHGVAETGGAEPEGVELGGAESEGAESWGAEPQGTALSGSSAGALPRQSPQQLREWLLRRARLWCGASRAGGARAAGAGGARVPTGAGVTGGTAAIGHGGARTQGTGATVTSGVGGAGAGDPMESGAAGAGGSGAGGAGAGGAGVGSTGVGDAGAGGAGAGGAGAVDPGGAVRPRPYFVPLLQQFPDPEFDPSRATSHAVSRLLATVVSYPSFESTAASALVAKLLDFAAACRLDYATALAAQSESASPPSVKGGCALGTDVLEDMQEDFECLAVAIPRFASMLFSPEGDPDTRPRALTQRRLWVLTPLKGRQPWMLRWRLGSPQAPTVKQPPGSPPAFKARYLAQGFSQRQRPTRGDLAAPPTWLHWVVSYRYPVEPPAAPREWHDTLRTTLAALGFAPSTADPSLFLRTDTSLPPFYVLMYVDDLVFATADTEALTLVQFELQKRHTCTDLGELRSYLGLQITRDRARRTITLTQSHMVHEVFQRFGFQFSSPQPTPLCTSHSLSAPPMTSPVLRYLCCTSGMGLVLGGRGPVVLTDHADASWVDDSATQRSSKGYTFSLGFGSVSWRLTRSPSVLSSNCEAEIYAGSMAAQELRWLTYLLTDLGE
ncbi:unnamed protein product [Closterium sp. NIES-53]